MKNRAVPALLIALLVPVTAHAGDSAPLIADFLKSWQQAWSNKDLDQYMSHYDEDFRSGRMDYRSWERRMERQMGTEKPIQLDLRNISLQSGSHAYILEFEQHVTIGRDVEVGFTTMELHPGPPVKIIREEWARRTDGRSHEPQFATLHEFAGSAATSAAPAQQQQQQQQQHAQAPGRRTGNEGKAITARTASPAADARAESREGTESRASSPRQSFQKVEIRTGFGGAEEGNDGYLFVDRHQVLFAKDKRGEEAYFSIPTSAVQELFYSRVSGRRIGAAVLVSPLLLFSKGRKHYMTITFDDGEEIVGAVEFKLHKSNYRSVLRAVERVAEVKMEYDQEGIKDSEQKPSESKTIE